MDNYDSIERYLNLVKLYPWLFKNDNSPESIRIVVDRDILYSQQANFFEQAKLNQKFQEWFKLGIVAEDEWILLLRDLVVFPNGKYGRYVRLINRNSSFNLNNNDVVILVSNKNKILLIHHFRHELRDWNWEFIRGFGEQGYSALENAKKEVVEEIGIPVISISRMDNQNLSNVKNQVAYFYADTKEKIKVEKEEAINNFLWVTKEELQEMIQNGRINDMFTIKAFTLALINKFI